MAINKYSAFVKTADLGSFTRAAVALNYTQSSISQMIAHLEEEWQVVLLSRSKSGVKLTPEGKALLPYARSLCESYNELQVQVAKVKGIHSGIIRIATFPSVAGTWLPNTIRAFSREYPLVDFEILMGDYEEIAQMLRDGRINCAIMSWPFNGEAPFDFTFIQNDNYVVLLSEESPLIKYDKIPLHILANEPMIMLEKHGLTEEISLFFEQNGIIPNVKFRAWDNNAIMCMVESGLGISMLSQLMIERSAYRIVTRELEVPAYRRIGYCVKDYRKTPELVKTFLAYINDTKALR